MSFKVQNNVTFSRVVTVNVPVNGGFKEETFKATFRVIPTNEAANYNLEDATDSRRFLQAAIVHLDDLADEAGNPLAYNDEIRDQVC